MSAIEIKYDRENVGIEVDNSETTTFLSSVLQAYRPWICLPVPFKEVRLRSCHYNSLHSMIKTVLDVHRATKLDCPQRKIMRETSQTFRHFE